jgi:hypothetical protein
MTTYQEFDTIPEGWTRARWDGDKLLNPDDPLRWSGVADPPPVGARVHANFNGLGAGTVLRYFVEDGWFGVIAALDKNPDWRAKQNQGNPPAHLFGIDLDPIKRKEPS